MEATDDEVAASVGDTVATADDTTAPDDSDDSSGSSDTWEPTTCPSCGSGVLMEVVMGPSEAHLAPCGCRVAPGHLHRQRQRD